VTKKRTPRLNALLDRIERICKNKSALARELGVSRDHIQKWITARQYEPGGEITLHLLEWVGAAEAKQRKALGDADNTAKSRTRLRNSRNERSKKSPPRKYRGGKR
jgi:hypothetical protein